MSMESHEVFLKNQLEASRRMQAAPQDVSLPILEDLINQGYESAVWVTSPGATDAPCISRDGDQYTLSDLVSGLSHSAPIFEQTHVGCKCSVTCNGPGLPEVVVSAFGIQ